jgi:hypothetical protein
MPIPKNKVSDHITQFRQILTNLSRAAQAADTFVGEYDALDLGNVITDEDFTGSNEGITHDEFVTAVAATKGLLTGLDSGVKTVIYKLLV